MEGVPTFIAVAVSVVCFFAIGLVALACFAQAKEADEKWDALVAAEDSKELLGTSSWEEWLNYPAPSVPYEAFEAGGTELPREGTND